MAFETISDSIKDVLGDAKEDYHHTVVAGNKIWFFSQKYSAQPAFNWGHRVTYLGGYAVAFDLATKKWEKKIEIPTLFDDENGDELVFELNNVIYLAIRTGFGGFEFKKVFKWTGSAFEPVNFTAPEKVSASESNVRITAHVAEGTSTNEKVIVVNVERDIKLYRFSVHGDISIEHISDAPADVNTMFGMAVSAISSNRRILIFFAVMGCGMRWEKNRVLAYDETTKEWKQLQLPGDFADGPSFSFCGAHARGVAPNGDWIHAGGSQQVGMTDSKFHGAIWALTNLGTDPEWKKLPLEIPSEFSSPAVIDSNSGKIYAIGEKIASASL